MPPLNEVYHPKFENRGFPANPALFFVALLSVQFAIKIFHIHVTKGLWCMFSVAALNRFLVIYFVVCGNYNGMMISLF